MIVFTRAPIAGRVKTRLVPRLGAAGAARLHQRLTAAAVRTALAARCGPVELHAAGRHGWLTMLSRKNAIALKRQRGKDLGERMAHATRAALRRAPFVLLIGSDCPELAPRELRRAARWLAGGADAVFAPARDGGYAMVGLARPADFLFRDMAWGSERVYGETALRLKKGGRRLRALGVVSDVDRPEDLERLGALRLGHAVTECKQHGVAGERRRAKAHS